MAGSTGLPTPLDMFYKWEETNPNRVFLSQPIDGSSHEYTWKQAGDEIRRIAAAIKARNLPANSKIGLVSKNCAHWLMTDLAIMMSGHTSVPIYPNVGPDTINYIINHSEAKILFVGKLDDWAHMKPGVPEGVEMVSFPMYHNDRGDEYTHWDNLLKEFEPMQEKVKRDGEELMTIIYTSGTTGQPKGVMQTYHAMSFAANNALQMIDANAPNGRFFSYLPLSHIAERIVCEMGSLYTGNKVVFAQSLDTFAQNLSDAQPTVFLAVPRIWTKFQMKILEKMPQSRLNLLLAIPILNNIIRKKIQTTLGLAEARHCLTGAAPTPPSLITWFGKLGITIQEVYGMTENCAYSHYTLKDAIKLGHTGQPMPYVDVKISDIGEILVKSEASMKGYYKEPEKTAASFDGEYLKTGDKGRIDEKGFLKITGRVKDIFKTAKGKYVAPNPIELKISANQNIEQICVVGTGIPQPIALVILSEDAQDEDQREVAESIAETLKEVNPKLEKHEKIKTIVVMKEDWTVENGVLTPTLKIKRSIVDEMFQDNYENWYAAKEAVVFQ